MNKHTPIKAIQTINEENRNLLSKKAVLAHVTIGGWSARKLDRKVTDDTNERLNAKDDAGRYNKLLLPKEYLDPITKVMSESRAAHYKITLPWMDDGARILPTANYMDYMKEQREFREKHRAAVADFMKVYPHIIKTAPDRLGDAFNPLDYPDIDRIPGMFYFKISVMPCPDAADFRVDLAEEHLSDIRNDIEQRMKEALDHAMKEPVQRIIDVVGNMVERLKNYKPAVINRDTGKVKKRAEFTFRDSLVSNVQDLIAIIPGLNLTGDKALKDLCDAMHKLTVYDPAALRDNKKAREETARAADAILAKAQALMA